jgi:hypothetical protein
MRCRALVVETVKVLKSGKQSVRVRAVGDDYEREDIDFEAMQKNPQLHRSFPYPTKRAKLPRTDAQKRARICGGEIVAEVVLESNGPCSCSGESIAINYKCKACKHTYHGPDVPANDKDLSRILTEYVANLPEPQ